MYIVESAGYYVYDLGGEIFEVFKTLADDKYAELAQKAIYKVWPKYPNFGIDVGDEDGNEYNWDVHSLDGTITFEKIPDEDCAVLKKYMSVNEFGDYSKYTQQIVMAIIDKFPAEFTETELAIAKEFEQL